MLRVFVARYTVKVTEDHMVSLQLGTSKPDVYIKLQVKDVPRVSTIANCSMNFRGYQSGVE